MKEAGGGLGSDEYRFGSDPAKPPAGAGHQVAGCEAEGDCLLDIHLHLPGVRFVFRLAVAAPRVHADHIGDGGRGATSVNEYCQ